MWIIFSLGEVASVGVHAVSSNHEGAKERQKIGATVVAGLWLSGLLSVTALALLPLDGIGAYFRLLGLGGEASAEVRAAGHGYLWHTVLGAFPMAAAGVVASGFKGMGLMRPALRVTALSVALNALVDPFLIWGCPPLGIPRMGPAGAAIATNLSSTLAFFLLARGLGRDFRVSIRWRARPKLQELRRIASTGLPMAMSNVLFTLSYVALGRVLTGLGPVHLAALGLGQRLESIQYTINEAFAAAAATLVGQWLGAGRPEEARKAARETVKLSAAVNAPLGLLCFLLAPGIIGVFTSDPLVAQAAASYLMFVAVASPLAAAELALEGALAGAGDTLPTLAAGLVLNSARVPIALLLAPKMGVQGAWLAIVLTTALKAAVKHLAFERSSLPLLVKAKAPSSDG
eukprot:CAMPEP_0172648216 /NCGR_PEP_ID=MMETSP1068-20121228/241156_1 /TAXON_ID=35684 /ORGANISM="Pseudopedinella elastica, Strain CCMP716" /LENGTH=401 /DNA_ID=CAMNT_0013462529 /DNA_START=433 /DNA_END=1638 /DNA_ORIENTATION=-